MFALVFFYLILYVVCMPECMCVHHVQAGADGRQETEPLKLELYTAVSHQCECWESNLGALEKQPVLLTAEPSLQSLVFISGTRSHYVAWAGLQLKLLLPQHPD